MHRRFGGPHGQVARLLIVVLLVGLLPAAPVAAQGSSAPASLRIPTEADLAATPSSSLTTPRPPRPRRGTRSRSRARPVAAFDALDPADWDVADLAATLGADPEAAFALVRDRIGFDAYAGSLRGAEGTLTRRAGNAVDRALLLQALLAATGTPARLAFGDLDAATAQAVLDRSLGRPTDPLPSVDGLGLSGDHPIGRGRPCPTATTRSCAPRSVAAGATPRHERGDPPSPTCTATPGSRPRSTARGWTSTPRCRTRRPGSALTTADHPPPTRCPAETRAHRHGPPARGDGHRRRPRDRDGAGAHARCRDRGRPAGPAAVRPVERGWRWAAQRGWPGRGRPRADASTESRGWAPSWWSRRTSAAACWAAASEVDPGQPGAGGPDRRAGARVLTIARIDHPRPRAPRPRARPARSIAHRCSRRRAPSRCPPRSRACAT